MRLPTLLVVIPAFALGGCGAPRVLSEAGISPKRVGVVSIVGETATLNYRGFTKFGHEQEYLPARSWKLDEKLESQLVSALAAHRASVFVALQVDRDALLREYDSRTLWPDWRVVLPKVVEVGRAHDVEAVLVATPGVFDANYGKKEPISGFGIKAQGAGGEHPFWVTAYLGVRLRLVDVKSGRVVAERLAATDPDASIWSTPVAPSMRLDPKGWKTNFEEVTPAQVALLAHSFEAMTDVVLQNAQRIFGLR